MIHLSSSGDEVSRTTLQLPRYFYVNSFAVLPDGRSMFFGYVPSIETSAPAQTGPFLYGSIQAGDLLGRHNPKKSSRQH